MMLLLEFASATRAALDLGTLNGWPLDQDDSRTHSPPSGSKSQAVTF